MMVYDKDLIYRSNWRMFRRNLKDIKTDKVIKTNKVDTLTNISYCEYSNPELWWIIAEYNNIPPYQTLNIGVELKIPSLKHINTLIKTVLDGAIISAVDDRGI